MAEKKIWVIWVDCGGWLKFKTKNPIETLEKLLRNFDYFAIGEQEKSWYIYLGREDVERLLKGEEVRCKWSTLPPSWPNKSFYNTYFSLKECRKALLKVVK